jgi:hypothetical protein
MLMNNSAAINAGTAATSSLAIPNYDFFGFIRDATPDIGAFEFGASTYYFSFLQL